MISSNLSTEQIQERLTLGFNTYPKEVQKATKYLLSNTFEIPLYSLRKISKMAQISPSTLVRLVKLLGFQRYDEFKNIYIEDAKKSVSTAVTSAWSTYQSSKSVLDSIRYQVKASEIANEGITLEYESGSSRTTLEVIQSRTILLDSRINLASSERNFLISQFNLLLNIGRLTAKRLNLKQ